MRNTRQKKIIFNIVNTSIVHPSANTIYSEARKLIPNISLGTVYRIINNLVENGMIKRIKVNDNIDRYDKISDFHAHFLCLKCNKVYDLYKDFNDIVEGINHQVINYEINFKGICNKCQKEGEK